jgi:hypothetical protein
VGSLKQNIGKCFVSPRWSSSLFELLIKRDVCGVFSAVRYAYVVCIII